MKSKLNNSSWKSLIDELKNNGLVFIGSVFNKTINDILPVLDEDKNADYYIDRRYLSGASVIKMSVLNKKGETIKTSSVDKSGSVFTYDRFFVVVKSNNFLIYSKGNK